MCKEVSNQQILQAISELSEEVKGVSQQVSKNAKKIDKLDAKVTVLSEGLLPIVQSTTPVTYKGIYARAALKIFS